MTISTSTDAKAILPDCMIPSGEPCAGYQQVMKQAIREKSALTAERDALRDRCDRKDAIIEKYVTLAEDAEKARDAAIAQLSEANRALGEAEGRLEASEMAGIVEGWKARAEAAEAKLEMAREALQEVMQHGRIDDSESRMNKVAAALDEIANEKAPPAD
ncbi:MAG: hypothetical protein LAT55_13805 [Opitutales bacterium]|nr:hypothetical protein [Opitutales bacterium]